jgi:hypothetical protein
VTIVEQITHIASTLPDSLAREALDFVCFLQARERGELNEWQNAQSVALSHIWDNAADEVWNDVPLR